MDPYIYTELNPRPSGHWPLKLVVLFLLCVIIFGLVTCSRDAVSQPRPPHHHCPASTNKRVVLLSNIRNEAFLLPYWIRHHAPMFDEAILIDYHSTDASRDILKRDAPSSWRVVTSRNAAFDARLADEELMDYENLLFRCEWRIVLTTPEFLVHPDLRGWLNTTARETYRFPSFLVVGNDTHPLDPSGSLVKQRSEIALTTPGASDSTDQEHGITQYSRFIHRNEATYKIGRHEISGPWSWTLSGFIFKYQWSPWPEIEERKLHVKDLIPASDFEQARSFQHNVNQSQLHTEHARWVTQTAHAPLGSFFPPKSNKVIQACARIWREIVGEQMQFVT